MSLLLWFEAHDLAYKTTGLGYGAFALGAIHFAQGAQIGVVLLIGVGSRSRLLAASSASGLSVWRGTVGELCLVDGTREDVRSCDDSKADCEAAAEERHGGPRTRMEVGNHCERSRVPVVSILQSKRD